MQGDVLNDDDDEDNRHLKSCGSRILENTSLLDSLSENMTFITVWEQDYIEVIGDEILDKLKSIEVVAEIYELDMEDDDTPTVLPYAPVNFDRPI